MEFAVSGAPAPSIFSANCRRRHLGDKQSEKAKFMMRTYNLFLIMIGRFVTLVSMISSSFTPMHHLMIMVSSVTPAGGGLAGWRLSRL
jgi:hypothetical protein